MSRMAMAEIEAETYPGDDPDMTWSDLKPVMMRGLVEFGAHEEDEEIPLEIVGELCYAMMQIWGVRTD